MAERSGDRADAINMTVPAASTESARASLEKMPDDLLRIILADLHPVQDDGPPDVTPNVNSTMSNELLLSAMRTCKRVYDVGRPILYRTPVISTARCHRTLTAWDWAWQLLRRLHSDQSIAELVFDSRHLAEVFERSRARTTIGAPYGELYDYSLEEALLEVCPFITDVAVTLYSCVQAKRVGKLLARAPNLRSVVIYDGLPSRRVYRLTDQLATLSLTGDGSAGMSPDLDNLTSCLQALVPAARSIAPPLATLDTFIAQHECDPESCRIALLVRKAARTLTVRTGGHTQLLCYSMPRRSFLYNPDLPRVTSVVISVMESQQSIDLNQLARDLNGNILETFAINRSVGPFVENLWKKDLQQYGLADVRNPRFSYTDQCYRLFPHVRKLCLPRGRDMDLSKLSALIETSPNLEYLDLSETEWSIRADALVVEQPGHLSSFEHKLVQILEGLAHLSYVHLGHWPFVNADGSDKKHGRSGLDTWARRRGIELLLSGCSRQ